MKIWWNAAAETALPETIFVMRKRMSVVAKGFAIAKTTKRKGSAQFASTCQPIHAPARIVSHVRRSPIPAPSPATDRQPPFPLSEILHGEQRPVREVEVEDEEPRLDRHDPGDGEEAV